MKTACYTDIHNQQAMLNYPTVLRKSAVIAAENTVAEKRRQRAAKCCMSTEIMI